MRATGRLVTIVCPLLLLPAGFAAAGEDDVTSASARCDASRSSARTAPARLASGSSASGAS